MIRKLLIVQILGLCLGIFLLLNTDGELPIRCFKNFSFSKIVIQNRRLVFHNVKRTKNDFQCYCPRLEVCFQNRVINVDVFDAQWTVHGIKLEHINGCVKKCGRNYSGYFSVKNNFFGSIHIFCDNINVNRLTLPALPEIAPMQGNTSRAQALELHIGKNQIHYCVHQLKYGDAFIERIYGKLNWPCARVKTSHALDHVHYKNNFFQHIQLQIDLEKDLKIKNFTCAALLKNEWFDNAEVLVQTDGVRNEPLQFLKIWLSENELQLSGELFKLQRVKFVCGKIPWTFCHKLIDTRYIPCKITSDACMYVAGCGDKERFNGVFDLKKCFLNENAFQQIYGTCTYTSNHLLCDVRLYSEETDPHLICEYDMQSRTGRLFCTGKIAPELTYACGEYLPTWWEPFFRHFQFKDKCYPKTNFALYWERSALQYCCGHVIAENCRFKNTPMDRLDMNFGNRSGYCWLRINDLQIGERHGRSEIHWVYDIDKPNKEHWQFTGNGQFSVGHWSTLLHDFIGNSKDFEYLHIFQPTSIPRIYFDGWIASDLNDKEHLSVQLAFPNTQVMQIPVEDLSAHYIWDPHKTRIQEISGKVMGSAPIKADIEMQGNRFQFSFTGENIQTQHFFGHPWFSTWIHDIPKDNLATYSGKLALNLSGEGQKEPLAFSGEGRLKFDNPNLSEIHLLGPLNHLFSKKLNWSPSISFDRLESKFLFNKNEIISQESVLLGPSTKASIEGKIDLSKKNIQSKIYFSFLDYQQLKVPILRHFVQIFQPVSKGFSVNISGPFSNPKWTLMFNPLHFVFR